jgi:hypothetical protein
MSNEYELGRYRDRWDHFKSTYRGSLCLSCAEVTKVDTSAKTVWIAFCDREKYQAARERVNKLALQTAIRNAWGDSELNSFLIGTDGVDDLIGSESLTVPGKTETVGNIRRWWEEDRFFRNPDQVRRTLTLANQETLSFDWLERTHQKRSGLLKDDTTLIAGRRTEASNV